MKFEFELRNLLYIYIQIINFEPNQFKKLKFEL